jgi:hypothetical protein
MALGPLLAQGRQAARRHMTDACLITRESGGTTNTSTGVVTPDVETIYEGVCQMQEPVAGKDGTETELGAAEVRLLGTVLKLPVLDSPGIRAGDRVVMTAASNDPDLVGRVYTVTGEAAKTAATARRLLVKEVTG